MTLVSSGADKSANGLEGTSVARLVIVEADCTNDPAVSTEATVSKAGLVRMITGSSVATVDIADPSRSDAALLSCSTGWFVADSVSAGCKISEVTLVRSGCDSMADALVAIASSSVVESPRTITVFSRGKA